MDQSTPPLKMYFYEKKNKHVNTQSKLDFKIWEFSAAYMCLSHENLQIITEEKITFKEIKKNAKESCYVTHF